MDAEELHQLQAVYARPGCRRCFGMGRLRIGTCGCVYRAIFSMVLARYRRADVSSRPSLRGILLRCDFELAARRRLRALELQVFRLHFVDGGDWRACCTVLHLDRGEFFHEVYRLEEKLGRELLRREVFPLHVYFAWGREPTIPVKRRQRNAEDSVLFDRRMAPEEHAALMWSERSDGWDAPMGSEGHGNRVSSAVAA